MCFFQAAIIFSSKAKIKTAKHWLKSYVESAKLQRIPHDKEIRTNSNGDELKERSFLFQASSPPPLLSREMSTLWSTHSHPYIRHILEHLLRVIPQTLKASCLTSKNSTSETGRQGNRAVTAQPIMSPATLAPESSSDTILTRTQYKHSNGLLLPRASSNFMKASIFYDANYTAKCIS